VVTKTGSRGQACVLCGAPLPRESELPWWRILLLLCNVWPGMVYLPGGWAHAGCADAMAL
jgi:hypothetical protein